MLEPTPHLRVSSDPLVRARSQKFPVFRPNAWRPCYKKMGSEICLLPPPNKHHLCLWPQLADKLLCPVVFFNVCFWFSWSIPMFACPCDPTIIILWVVAEQVYTPLRLSPEKVKKSNFISDSITRIFRGKILSLGSQSGLQPGHTEHG